MGCVEGPWWRPPPRCCGGAGPKLLHFGIADTEAWDVGLPCGGEIDVFVEEYRGGAPRASSPHRRGGRRAALVTVIAGPGETGAKLLVRHDGRHRGQPRRRGARPEGAEAAEELMWAERSERREVGERTLFVDVTAPAPRLVIFGAVDYAAALCGSPGPPDGGPSCATRARSSPRRALSRGGGGDRGLARGRVRPIGGIDRATYIAVLTHDPKLDDAALELALRSEAAYVGAMGSRRAQAQRRERLLAAGVEEELLERIAAPIGLDLGAVTPEETALSIMAEVVAVRNGRDGGRLAAAADGSTRWARDRRPRPCRRRRHALRRPSSSRCWTGGRCSSTRCAR